MSAGFLGLTNTLFQEEPMTKQNLHLEIIRCFISNAEIDVNTKGVNGKTALHYAIESNDLALVDLLFSKKNVNPFVKDNTGKAPLDYAQEENNAEILQTLTNNKYGPDQDSLLHLAAVMGEVRAVRYLIRNGIDTNLRNASHHTPLHLAAGAGHESIITILVKEGGASLDLFDARNQTPLHYAVNNKRLKIVELLIKLKADINAVGTGLDSTGLSPLHIAVSNSSYDERDLCLDIVKCLINTSQCEINPQDYESQTPLHYAVDGDGLNTTDVLLTRKDIDPLMKDDHGKTPFEYALDENKHEIAKTLMDNQYGAEKNSLLHLAAQKGLLKIVDTLISKGENVNVINNKSQSPIDLAAEKGHLNVVELLLKRGASVYAKESTSTSYIFSKYTEIKDNRSRKLKTYSSILLMLTTMSAVIILLYLGPVFALTIVIMAIGIIVMNQIAKRLIEDNFQKAVLAELDSRTEITTEDDDMLTFTGVKLEGLSWVSHNDL